MQVEHWGQLLLNTTEEGQRNVRVIADDPAAEVSRAVLGVVAFCLVICISAFVWASGTGYGFRDEAYYLVVDSNPYAYPYSITSFGFLWRPFYLLAGGDIALFRVFGIGVLLACAVAFALALARFATASGANRAIIVITIPVGVFWSLGPWGWMPTPGYNEMNLSALLLFFCGLLAITPGDNTPITDGVGRGQISAVVLSGVGLAVMALVKQSTCVLAVLIAIVWLAVLRPPKSLLWVAISALSGLVTMAVAIAAIHGSASSYLSHLETGLRAMALFGTPNDAYGLVHSVGRHFAPDRRWKMIPSVISGALILGGCLWTWRLALGRRRSDDGGRSVGSLLVFATLIAGFSALTLMSRSLQLHGLSTALGYYSWYFIFAIALGALWLLLAKGGHRPGLSSRTAPVAIALLFAPFAYSFGTHAALIIHMTTAGVFWAAALMVTSASAVGATRATLLSFSSALCGLTSVAIMVGDLWMPFGAAPSIWQQRSPIVVGRDKAKLLVDRETAAFVNQLQQAAKANGFRDGEPLLDFSEMGPGIVFALSGSAPWQPWLFADQNGSLAYVRQVLEQVPPTALHRAWIVTGAQRPLSEIALLAASANLSFPSGYVPVAQVHLREPKNHLTLWRPISETRVH